MVVIVVLGVLLMLLRRGRRGRRLGRMRRRVHGSHGGRRQQGVLMSWLCSAAGVTRVRQKCWLSLVYAARGPKRCACGGRMREVKSKVRRRRAGSV